LVTFAAAAPAAQAQGAGEVDGAAALGLALRRLGTTKRVLMIGAHPDDENTAVLSELALGDGAAVAYLSLTRGEGGQNLIGPELQEPLGIIRSEELLAARRLDGARQFFTRAYDYGFSKNAEEAFSQWPRDSLLADVVAVIRRFQPDVVIAVFSGTPRDGHGQHQASGIMAREAFVAAADPARFTRQIRAGLPAHQADALYQALYRGEPDEAVVLETGALDPLLGRSHFQIAMASRSRHRSQDMGRAQPLGPRSSVLIPIAGEAAAGGSLFASVDTTLSDIARASGASSSVVTALEGYEAEVAGLRDTFNPFHTYESVPHLATMLGTLRRVESQLPEQAATLRFRLESERDDAIDALRRAAGLVFDATVDDARVVPGQAFTLEVTLWNGGVQPIEVRSMAPRLPDGWRSTALDSGTASLAPQTVTTRRFSVEVPSDAPFTQPYYLRQPRAGEMYTWPADFAVRGLPFAPPVVNAHAEVVVAGETVPLDTEATFSDVDKAVGERRLPVLVVPRIAVTVEPGQLVIPLDPGAAANGAADPGRELTVVVTSEAPDGIEATARVSAPANWHVAPASIPLRFEDEGATRTLSFNVVPPAGLAPGEYALRAVVEAAGARYDRGYQLVDYPHTRPRALYRDATVDVSAFDVAIAPDLTIGYIEGAGDDGAEAIEQLGATVEQIDADALATGDLSRYDAIVTGIRAYEVRPDLVAHNRRLLDYVRDGGLAVIQYNKYEFAEGGFAPYPLTMARPHGRVTDETAPVRLLAPEHPILSWPNRIGPADFEGWVQERGLYFADTWDDRYTPLLAMNDPGEDPLEGSLLVANVGDGTYVYTGLALFRQLPAGVPGAYRILANLVSLDQVPR
ncbi:MAG: PIG-L family deacetylase, partial [Longimicrobiales bacterium]